MPASAGTEPNVSGAGCLRREAPPHDPAGSVAVGLRAMLQGCSGRLGSSAAGVDGRLGGSSGASWPLRYSASSASMHHRSQSGHSRSVLRSSSPSMLRIKIGEPLEDPIRRPAFRRRGDRRPGRARRGLAAKVSVILRQCGPGELHRARSEASRRGDPSAAAAASNPQ
jgi:hypothetical protein